MKIMNLFNNRLHPQSPSEQDFGYIEINGTFTGDICNGMDVYVAPSGRIKGNIKSRTLAIAGEVEGNVETYSLVIHSSGRLFYHLLAYRELIVEDGGLMVYINGLPDHHIEPAISRALASQATVAQASSTPSIGNVPATHTPSKPALQTSETLPPSPQAPDKEKPLLSPAEQHRSLHNRGSNKNVHFQSSF